jgi:hypothetical protein
MIQGDQIGVLQVQCFPLAQAGQVVENNPPARLRCDRGIANILNFTIFEI